MVKANMGTSETPRTDREFNKNGHAFPRSGLNYGGPYNDEYVCRVFAERLERELIAFQEQLKAAQDLLRIEFHRH